MHLEVPLAKLGAELERRVGRRLAEERDVDIGPAGVLHYSVEREAFTASVARGTLVVEAPIRARAEACSGARCYAACEPAGTARVELPLALSPEYGFEPSRVSFRFTRGCKVRVLGGFLTVDVTSMLEAQAAPRLQRLAREIDRGLPDVRAEAERAYVELSKPLRLPLGACLELRPFGLVQGPIEDSTRALRARFALRARPELLPECADHGAASLPLLERELDLPAEDVAALDMNLPLSSVARAFERAIPGAEPHEPLHVTRATVQQLGTVLGSRLTLAGETCGTVTLRAAPAYTGDGRFVTLSAPALDGDDQARARAVELDAGALARSLAQGVRITPPISADAARAALPLLGSVLSRPRVAVSVRFPSVRPAGAGVRDDMLVARLEARGSVHVLLE